MVGSVVFGFIVRANPLLVVMGAALMRGADPTLDPIAEAMKYISDEKGVADAKASLAAVEPTLAALVERHGALDQRLRELEVRRRDAEDVYVLLDKRPA